MRTEFVAVMMAVAFVAPALAEGGDMAQLKCSELVAMPAESAGAVLFWIDGYLSHKTGVTIVDFEAIKANGANIGEYCGANPDALVLEFVETATN
jgi:hypothetical protein